MTRKSAVALAMLLVVLGWVSSLVAQPPVTRRLTVRKRPSGYVVLGFRADVGRQERFRMTAGMTTDQIRQQIRSVRWTTVADRLDDRLAELAARRDRIGGAREQLVVRLNAPGGRAYSVQYTVWPARYSRFGLTRLLRSAFGDGTTQVDRPEQLRMAYRAPEAPITLTVQADRLPDTKSQWTLTYTIVDPALSPPPAGPSTEPAAPAGPIELIQIYPVPPPATQPAESSKRPPTATAPAPPGWKTVYPPKESDAEKR